MVSASRTKIIGVNYDEDSLYYPLLDRGSLSTKKKREVKDWFDCGCTATLFLCGNYNMNQKLFENKSNHDYSSSLLEKSYEKNIKLAKQNKLLLPQVYCQRDDTSSNLMKDAKGKRKMKTSITMNSLLENEDEDDYDSGDDGIIGRIVPPKKEEEFSVLGISYEDNDYRSLILTSSIMKALRPHLPLCIQEYNFWLKYSMIRDGANIGTLLQKVKSSKRTILAIETMEGDVIGAFTSAPWCTNGSRGYFGSCEAFVWHTKDSSLSSCATTTCSSTIATTEEEQRKNVGVFHWSGKNCNIQALVNEKQQLMIGGGVTDDDNYLSLLSSMSGDIYSSRSGNEDEDSDHDDNGDGGCSIIINADMLNGSSSECATFSSPPLIVSKPTSSTMSTTSTINTTATNEFQIVNLEVWSFTPFDTVDEAEKLECGVKFQVDHRCDY
mmetsp:Transcript_264/g.301  ORF Transcript_264/g.301 Transcript_264/m.301 type:complete len:438 (+) Transcript_264:242-1555(+)